MPKKFRQDNLLKFANVFNDELFAIKSPKYNLIVLGVLNWREWYIQYFKGLLDETSNLKLIVSNILI